MSNANCKQNCNILQHLFGQNKTKCEGSFEQLENQTHRKCLKASFLRRVLVFFANKAAFVGFLSMRTEEM